MHERVDVLGQAAAAEAEARVEELPTDALIVAECVGEHGDVGAGGLAELRDRVDERDLRGQERVRAHLDELRGRQVARDERGASGQRRRVDAPHDLLGRRAGSADDDAIRGEGVFHGPSLAQELGIPDQLGAHAGGRRGRRECSQPPRGSHRHGRLPDDDAVVGEVRRDSPGRVLHETQVGCLARRRLRCADADEVHVGCPDRRLEVGGEPQAPARDVGEQQLGEPRLEEGHLSAAERRDLARVGVDADDLEAHLGHGSGMRRAEVAGADDAEHEWPRPFGGGPLRGRRTRPRSDLHPVHGAVLLRIRLRIRREGEPGSRVGQALPECGKGIGA